MLITSQIRFTHLDIRNWHRKMIFFFYVRLKHFSRHYKHQTCVWIWKKKLPSITSTEPKFELNPELAAPSWWNNKEVHHCCGVRRNCRGVFRAKEHHAPFLSRLFLVVAKFGRKQGVADFRFHSQRSAAMSSDEQNRRRGVWGMSEGSQPEVISSCDEGNLNNQSPLMENVSHVWGGAGGETSGRVGTSQLAIRHQTTSEWKEQNKQQHKKKLFTVHICSYRA